MSTLKVYDHSTNYTATVIKLPVKQAIDGLDNLVLVNVFGNDCLVGKGSNTEIKYLYFPAGSQLSQKFLSGNNLYRDCALNVDSTQTGFFEPNGRVKGIKLRGIVSTGFVIPVHSLKALYDEGIDKDFACSDIAQLKVGEEFNEFDGIEVCRKWTLPVKGTNTPGEKKAKVNSKLSNILIPTQFRFHQETGHLAKNLHVINPEDVIVITDKWHGSSCIISLVYVNKPIGWFKKLWNKVGWLPKFATRKMAYIYSSGKPKSHLPKGIADIWENKGFDFYESNIWQTAYHDYKDKLEEGISLYGELVGYAGNGAYIQPSYDYKCGIGQSRFMVYRITYTKPNGEYIEFSWQQIKAFCKKYGLEHVKQLYFGRAMDFYKEGINLEDETDFDIDKWRQGFFDKLQQSFNLEQYCKECHNKVAAEGIVVRVDGHLMRYEAYKLKSKLFIFGETNSNETNIEDEQ